MYNTKEIRYSTSVLFSILLLLDRIMNLFRTLKREDNVVSSVYRLIKAYHIKISITAVAEYLKPHKDYPSLKSICDFFNEINLENYPVRVEVEDIYTLPKPFLVFETEIFEDEPKYVKVLSKKEKGRKSLKLVEYSY